MITEWQINSGSSYPLLQYPHAPCLHLEGSWLTTTRTFLSSINGSISIANSYCPTPSIPHDIAIMDAFHTISGIGRKSMQQLNSVSYFYKFTSCLNLFIPMGWLSNRVSGLDSTTTVPGNPYIDIPANHLPHPGYGPSGDL